MQVAGFTRQCKACCNQNHTSKFSSRPSPPYIPITAYRNNTHMPYTSNYRLSRLVSAATSTDKTPPRQLLKPVAAPLSGTPSLP